MLEIIATLVLIAFAIPVFAGCALLCYVHVSELFHSVRFDLKK